MSPRRSRILFSLQKVLRGVEILPRGVETRAREKVCLDGVDWKVCLEMVGWKVCKEGVGWKVCLEMVGSRPLFFMMGVDKV